MTLSILVFNFYPLTAVMIVMLALLNDGAILSIAYDNVHYKDQPEAWNMRLVLGIATALGIIGVVSAFGLFYLGERVFHLDRAHIQTLMYLKLSVAGHLTIFLTRTRGPFWSIRPARVLWVAVLGTQALATLIAVYGLLMTPLGWGWALFVWGYALAWFLVNDRVKLLAYRILDPAKAGPKLEAKAEPQPEAKPEPDAKAEAEPKSDAKPERQPAVKAKPEAEADVAALLNTTLGEILVAGLVKDTEDAGRLIAQGIIQTEARIAAAKTPEAEPEPEAKAKTPPASTAKAAE
jgi:H+-transporting ATPase